MDAARVGEFGGRRFADAHLGVNAQFADLSGDEVAILATGVQDDDLRCGDQI